MNERIKELWENCDEIHTRYPKKGSPIYASPELLEKFAELIIRECAQVCRDQPNVFAMKLDRENCAIAIEEHFGVEE